MAVHSSGSSAGSRAKEATDRGWCSAGSGVKEAAVLGFVVG